MKMRKTRLQWTATVPIYIEPQGGQAHMTMSWEVDFNRRTRILYRLLALPALPPADEKEDEEKQNSTHLPPAVGGDNNTNYARLSNARVDDDGTLNVSSGVHSSSISRCNKESLSSNKVPAKELAEDFTHANLEDAGHISDERGKNADNIADAVAAEHEPASFTWASHWEQTLCPQKQYWTLRHSIYANMGGLVYRLTASNLDELRSLTSRTLADIIRNNYSAIDLLQYLVLAEEDIKDKSKADWLLKTIAVLQICWLILNACARAAAGLPVTQLEVATGAFAVMAVATFLINWWKPKDVSRPTIVWLVPATIFTDSNYRCHSFTRRILSPSHVAFVTPLAPTLISNDTILMDGKPPLILVLIAISSLVFGGLHGLAWNSEFPSRTEVVLWRTSFVVVAALPGIILAITFIIEHLATNLPAKRFSAGLVKLFVHLDQVPPEYWSQLKEPFPFLSWPLESQIVFFERLGHADSDTVLNWEKMPTPPNNISPEATLRNTCISSISELTKQYNPLCRPLGCKQV
ncbi:hypothetical protein GLAREA_04309 [Glarea lozoyensis ATCC 20868]|uniref:Uncharacterized protein n=1 Tax=Glarea lozoyensis (strain ATCC 20868 / MF5171) TaxID=1116229 RepID=S3DLW0_GLAL2|nr:uncharacterized protein GLAREA_04309 [Glarea lozoyensis ATCC 20868]EPE27518.1 hypothetical protein GLAREA_04309 [Glarea lozoyensis ATCC 20868]